MKTLRYILFLPWLTTVLAVYGQTDVRQQTPSDFEKIYVQTDKPFYAQEETIWYKLFLVNARDNTPSPVSDAVYAELHDPQGHVVFRHLHQVKDGTANGEFPLRGEYPGGRYTLVAYTRWMSGQGKESYFRKELTVQQVITPRLLLKLEFGKRAYAGGDEVEANLEVTDLNNIPAEDAQVTADIRIGGTTADTVHAVTREGKAQIRFTLPEELDTADGILQAVVSFRGVNESISRSIPIILNHIQVSFYPEGGDLTAGFTNRVAFEALNEWGKGADISGEVLDSSGRQVATFESYHRGMGFFEFTPQAGERYEARILRPQQAVSQSFPLPDVRSQGYGLSLVAREENKVIWNIHASCADSQVRLIATTHGAVCHDEPLNLRKGVNRVEVDTRKFPAGIAVFTLADERGEGLCERLVFLNGTRTLNIRVETKKIHFPGTQGSIQITTTDEEGNPVPALLGVSVVDEQLLTFADDKQDHLLSYLLMSSDLQGEIEEPFFYFNKKEPKAGQALDCLLLTHGWRRYYWEILIDPHTGGWREEPENSTYIHGRLLDQNKQPIGGEKIFLLNGNSRTQIAEVVTTPEGYFTFIGVDRDPDNYTYMITRRPHAHFEFPKHSPMTLRRPSPTPTAQEQRHPEEVPDETEPDGKQAEEAPDTETESEEEALVLEPDAEPVPETETSVQQEEPVAAQEIPAHEDPPPRDAKLSPPAKQKQQQTKTVRSKKTKVSGNPYPEKDMAGLLALAPSTLSEVVVVGYGTTQKRDMSTVSSTYPSSLLWITDPPAYAPLLSQAVPGLQISRTAHAGQTQITRMYGPSTLVQEQGPLLVVDGRPVYRPYREALFALPQPREIGQIRWSHIPPGNARYGNRGANGVLEVTTETTTPRTRHILRAKKPVYTVTQVPGKEYYRPARFPYQPADIASPRTTLMWNGTFTTNQQGEGTLSFINNRESSAFRITVEGIDPQTGLAGHATHHFITEKFLSLDAKVPVAAAVNDSLRIPVLLRNTTASAISGKLKTELYRKEADGKVTDRKPTQQMEVEIAPHSTRTVYILLPQVTEAGSYMLSLRADYGENQSETFSRLLPYREIHIPMHYGFSGRNVEDSVQFALPVHIPGTLRAEAATHTRITDELIEGVESIFSAPHGCFEQLSSATFPNIFALQLLQASNREHTDLRDRAMKYLVDGYKKLAAYEIKGGGFEWFGKAPAHEVLSAYGLLEFTEMAKVYQEVDKKMLERTYHYLLSRRNGTGGFHHHKGRYGFSGVPDNVGDAYIIYALTESGYTQEIDNEYRATLQEALRTKDLYRMALLANAAYHMEDTENHRVLIGHFRDYILTNGFQAKEITTIVRSYGENSLRETVAFWTLALLKEHREDNSILIDQCIQYITEGKRSGGFGSTQTTSLCLQALTRYTETIGTSEGGNTFRLTVNGKQYSQPINGAHIHPIDFTEALHTGENRLRILYPDSEKPYSYSVNVHWYTQVPPTSVLCPLELNTRLSENELKVNGSTRMEITLTNTQQTGQPMSIAIIGIPAGMSLQPWQLKELQEKEVFDFYEIIDENLVIYYREMGPREVRQIHLDLKAEIPGSYQSIASCAYLYYMDWERHWIPGTQVKIDAP